MAFIDTFTRLCNKKGVSPSLVCLELGLSNSTYSFWKKNNSVPRSATLSKIAEYFDVSVDYLTNENEQIFNPGDVVEVNLNLNRDLGHGETRFIHSMEHHNIARNMLNSIVVDPQEQMLLDIFRNTTEEGKLRIIQSIMNIRDEIEKKSALSNTAHNE